MTGTGDPTFNVYRLDRTGTVVATKCFTTAAGAYAFFETADKRHWSGVYRNSHRPGIIDSTAAAA